MRIAVFGTGGAGGVFGAKLAQAGEEVVFIARGEHLRAIQARGLQVDGDSGSIIVRPSQASDDPAAVGMVDVVLLGVKTWQVAEAAQSLRPLVGPDTFVVPLQNGVEAAEQLAAALGREHVVGGLCSTISFVVGPGRIRSVGSLLNIKFSELDNRPSRRTERLRDAFARSGANVEIPADIQVALWEKFLFVVPQGSVGAVTRAPVGIYRSLPETRRLLAQALDEIFALARGHQVALADDAASKTLATIDALPPTGTTSLQRDILAGKPSELEAWTGAAVRLGQAAAVATPLHAFLYASLLPMESKARGRLQFTT